MAWKSKMESVTGGIWRGSLLGRPLWLVSNRDVPVDRESAPVRMVSEQTEEATRQLAKVVLSNDDLLRSFGAWLGASHPETWKELKAMVARRKKGDIDWEFFAREMDGLMKAIEVYRPDELVQGGGAKKLIDKIGMDRLVEVLTPEQRRELAKRIGGKN